MQHLLRLSLISFFSASLYLFNAQAGGLTVTINLAASQNNNVNVEVWVPNIEADSLIFRFPAIIPGTYFIQDFGRCIENFKATDINNNQLTAHKNGVNAWTILTKNKLAKISYTVTANYSSQNSYSRFGASEAYIKSDSVFLLNLHAFVGFLDEKETLPYKLIIKHSSDFYGSTALIDLNESNIDDTYNAQSYYELIENPILYCRPDTSYVTIDESKILVSLYSGNKKFSSQQLVAAIEKLLLAQAKYLGGILPVKKYAFLVFMADKSTLDSYLGALEHPYSSVYFIKDAEPEDFSVNFRNWAAHEFFHIVAPLSIHSLEIQNFNFNIPVMSEHLWFYEGSTEYHTHLAQVKFGIINRSEFLAVINSKINESLKNYNDTLSFTRMSKNCFDIYRSEYGNVYEKGALINMCLDIELRKLSEGKYGIQNLIDDLSKLYGKQKPFLDNEFFTKVAELTFPNVKVFFERYVAGSIPLPYKEYLSKVGIDLRDTIFHRRSFGGATWEYDPDRHKMKLSDDMGINSFGKAMKYRLGDLIVSINNFMIGSKEQFDTFTNHWYSTVKDGDYLSMKVLRLNKNKKLRKVKLTGAVFTIERKAVKLEFMKDISEQQLKLRESWLK